MQQHFRLIMMQLAVDCNNLGVKYNEQGQWQDALEMFQGSLQLVMYLSTKYKTEDHVIQNDLCIQRAQFMLEQSTRYPSKVLDSQKGERIMTLSLQMLLKWITMASVPKAMN